MRGPAFLLVAALAVIVAVATAAGGAAPAPAPSLRLLDRDPLVVRGRGFARFERIVATAATVLGPRVVRSRASARGIVTVRFPRLTVGPCAGAFAVRLVGASGRMAAKRLAVRGACAPLAP